MHVGLNKTWQNGAVARVDHNIGLAGIPANSRDEILADQQIAAHDATSGIHRDQRSVFDDDRFFHYVKYGVRRQSEADSALDTAHLAIQSGVAPRLPRTPNHFRGGLCFSKKASVKQ